MDDALRQETKARIEDHCVSIVDSLLAGQDPAAAGGLGPLCFTKHVAEDGLGGSEEHRGAYNLASMLKIIRSSYELLDSGGTATQRELYYLNAAWFEEQGDAQEAIKHATVQLGLPSHRLGVFAASRGWCAGSLVDTDCGSGVPSAVLAPPFLPPRPVPASAVSEAVPLRLAPGTDFILLVEKECIFRRLCEDRVWEQPGMRCAVLTGCGFPDLATRACVSQLWAGSGGGGPTHGTPSPPSRRRVPVYGLCDWNVFGLGVLLSYTRGSKAHPESGAWAVPVQWLGLHSGDIEAFSLPESALQRTTAVDEARAAAMLRDPLVSSRPDLEGEVQAWLEGQEKMELEGILHHGLGFLSHDYLPAKVAGALEAGEAIPLGQDA